MNNKHHLHLSLAAMRSPGFPLRAVTAAVVALFLNAVLMPTWAVAAEIARENERRAEARWQQDNERLDQVLENLKHASKRQRHGADERQDTLCERDRPASIAPVQPVQEKHRNRCHRENRPKPEERDRELHRLRGARKGQSSN